MAMGYNSFKFLFSSTHQKHKVDDIFTVDFLRIQAETATDQNEEEPVLEDFYNEFDELIKTVISDEVLLTDSVQLHEI